MATIWKGSVAFGLVNIPVEMRSAVRTDRISFRLLHEEDLSPIKYERVCQADGEPVPWNEIVKGYEYEKGKFIVMTDEDFEAAAIESSRTIDILDFVKEEEIDPRFFETPYYLVPTKGGEKAYALLREAIRESGTIGIGKQGDRRCARARDHALRPRAHRRDRALVPERRRAAAAGAADGAAAHCQPRRALRSREVHR
jgi:DNA end-binding protein Ku